MKSVMITLSLFLAGLSLVSAQDAASIVQSSRKRIKAIDTSIQFKLKQDNQTEKTLYQFSKDTADGSTRMAVAFETSNERDVTRLLIVENPGKPDDIRVFMNNTIRTLNARDSAGAFGGMGTNFSYNDIAIQTRRTDLDNHTLLREDTVNGNACYVIESVPKDSSFQYSKMIQWIDKATYVNYKVEFYNASGAKIKTYEVLKVEEFQGRLTPTSMKMTNETNARRPSTTTITVVEVKYDVNFSEKIFTDDFLRTGKY